MSMTSHMLTCASGMCSTVLALLSHDQLQEVGVLKMGDRVKLIRRANEHARGLQSSGWAPNRNDQFQPDSATAADFLSKDDRVEAAPIVQALPDSRGVAMPTAFYDTFLAHGRKVRFVACIASCFALQNCAMPFLNAQQIGVRNSDW